MMREPKFSISDLEEDESNLCNLLIELSQTPGPTRCIAKMSNDDPRLDKKYEFPLFEKIQGIVNEMNRTYFHDSENKVSIFQEFGSIVLISGYQQIPSIDEIKKIPVTIASHGDEITYLLKKDLIHLLPIFNWKPYVKNEEIIFMHSYVDIFGFIYDNKKECEFKKIGFGKIKIELKKSDNEEAEPIFKLEHVSFQDKKTKSRGLKEGDLVIQKYPFKLGKYDTDESIRNRALINHNGKTIINSKGMDDRVGVLAHLYTIKELNKNGIKAKAIIVGDEEGITKDVAWAKLARPIFRKYCIPENIIIICDGFDGNQLKEFRDKKGEYMDQALIVPYRSKGRGAGDPGLFALFRDKIIPICEKHGFGAITTTDYVSRSFDPKIMDDFPMICFIDWSNGPIDNPIEIKGIDESINLHNVCHIDESVSIKQVMNIIGTTFWTIWYFTLEKGKIGK